MTQTAGGKLKPTWTAKVGSVGPFWALLGGVEICGPLRTVRVQVQLCGLLPTPGVMSFRTCEGCCQSVVLTELWLCYLVTLWVQDKPQQAPHLGT